MTGYDLIVPSASRPHCLRVTLETLFRFADILPTRLLLHNDPHPTYGDQDAAIREVLRDVVPKTVPIVYSSYHDSPLGPTYGSHATPRGHGPALHWLLSRVETEFVLYSQDDHEVVRDLPLVATLAVMRAHDLHQVRFNKRATLEYKETWQGRWYKQEVQFGETTLTVADHWYFQTGLWRVAPIKAVVDWFMAEPWEKQWFNEHCEAKVNRAMDGMFPGFPPGLIDLPTSDPREAETRAKVQRTFIFGPRGHDRYIKHLGGDPKDWALTYNRGA